MKAVLCPVCNGSGIVDAGFYCRTSKTWTGCGGVETCRACGGKGWVEIHEDYVCPDVGNWLPDLLDKNNVS